MIRPLTAGALLALLACAPAAAAEPASATAAAEDEQRICRTIANTGWRTKATRVCRTRAEWEEWARVNAIDIDTILKRRSASSASN